MLSNYLKLAWRILGRKKFFTFISLFGTSFTLGILMVIISFLQSELGTSEPLSNKDQLIYLNTLALQRRYFDTIITVDTIVEMEEMKFDTTMEFKQRGRSTWNSDMNNGIAEDYLSDLSSMEDETIFNYGAYHDVYVNGVKLTIQSMYTDPSHFKIFDYQLLEGRFMDKNDMDQASKVMIINQDLAENYFGMRSGVTGKMLEMDGSEYRIIGVIKTVKKAVPFVGPDAFVPYTCANEDDQTSFYHGYYNVIFKRKANVSLKTAKKEIEAVADLIPLDHPSKPEGYNEVVFRPQSYDEMFAKALYYDEDEEKSYTVMKWVLISLLSLFVLLPTLNLINLNVSRIMDRSSEIGVRKAYGAHQGNILAQFVTENIVQTIIGGLIGLVLAISLINLLNNSGALGDIYLIMNPKFYVYSLLATLFFGILSGLAPAYKMSKLHIVNALKNNKI